MSSGRAPLVLPVARAPSKAASAPTAPATRSALADTRVLALHGKDRFRQDQVLHELRQALYKVHGEDGIDTVRFDGVAGPRILADVLDECRSGGLLARFKVVIVDNAEMVLKADEDAPAPSTSAASKGTKGRRAPAARSPRDLIEAYAHSPSDSAVLVLRADRWYPGNLDKAITRVGSVVKCEPLSFDDAVQQAMRRAKEHHQTSIDQATARLLVDAIGTELGRIDAELEKLALAAGGTGQPITHELVAEFVGVTREEDFFTIQAALLTGDPRAALGQLRRLIEVSRHDPVPINWAYAELARKVHVAACGLASNIPLNAIIPALKVWGPNSQPMISAIMNAGRASGPVRSARLLASCIQTDAANKSGLGDPVRNLERLTVRFVASTRVPASARR